jgi:hypothetical protein
VLRPGGWLLLQEVAKGAGAEVDYPTPWAAAKEASFLQTPEVTRAPLDAAGFSVERVQDKVPQARAYRERVRVMLDRGGKPPDRAVELIHGDAAPIAIANMAAAAREGRIVPIEVFARAVI